jgi:hypothetical protein
MLATIDPMNPSDRCCERYRPPLAEAGCAGSAPPDPPDSRPGSELPTCLLTVPLGVAIYARETGPSHSA